MESQESALVLKHKVPALTNNIMGITKFRTFLEVWPAMIILLDVSASSKRGRALYSYPIGSAMASIFRHLSRLIVTVEVLVKYLLLVPVWYHTPTVCRVTNSNI